MSATEAIFQWVDSHGVTHNLTAAKRLSTGEVALRLNCSVATALDRINARELGPVLRHNARQIEVFEVGLIDYLARKMADKKQK